MKVTVCESPNDWHKLEEFWCLLKQHLQQENSDFLLLPEMPFGKWPARHQNYDVSTWQQFVNEHKQWLERLSELPVTCISGSVPIIKADKSLNEAFLWDKGEGYRNLHYKYYLPDEEGFWEASWYEKGEKDFRTLSTYITDKNPVNTLDATNSLAATTINIGAMICTEMWFTEHARKYAREGVHLLVCPRATEMYSANKWLAGGRAAAVMAGAFCLSSNRGGIDEEGIEWGSGAWIIDPDGEPLIITTPSDPIASVEIEIQKAEAAKLTYPRYVCE